MKRYLALLMVFYYMEAGAGDISITNISLDDKVNAGKHWIEGTVSNPGTAPINSFTVNWTINNGVPRTHEFTGLNITPGNNYDWTHSLGWGAENTGFYTFKVWISEVNGSNALEEVQKTVEVFNAKRTCLIEVITSANCGPCAVHVPPLQQRVESASSFAISVEYHAGPGAYSGDPMYNDNVGLYNARMGYYNGTGYPTATVNGDIGNYNWPPQISSQVIYGKSQDVSDFTIENVIFAIDSGMANFSADITSVNAPSSYILSYKVQAVLIEKEVKFATPPGTNGEKEWVNVAKEFYPTHFQGTFLRDVLNAGFISGSFDLSTLNIYDQSQLGVILFIQNNSLTQPNGLREVYQSAMADLRGEPDVTVPPVPTAIENYPTENALKLYPNPTTDMIMIELPPSNDASDNRLTVTNLSGQHVRTVSLQDYNGTTLELNVSDLEDGIYFIRANISGKNYSQRIEVMR